jgi:hypothetical protein
MLVRHIYGKQIENYIDDIESLRLNVFKDFPYLYDENIEDEHEYLEQCSLLKNILVLLVLDNDKVAVQLFR